ncbi:GAF domain-containing protein [Gordonia sp. HY002]|uniref:sigma-54-dependent Fis family transcriptional regulator n=1 Tax=Gordonia zhenghanii TaxID=2911516 RepID=UPI001EF0C44E|nr:helix-turn-helix domain-containing protein [Gordonia zhenghanii]MCF8570351.1 GAF domain-containing protein [Gordonia zhenghanii]MCF8607144.1 GAF domain-containing protein [Gordonia zhenghanii]
MPQHDLIAVRHRFLTDATGTDGVRESISNSWRRSMAMDISADPIDLQFVREPELDSPLVEAARPIMQRLADGLESEPVSAILTSDDGVVLSRAGAIGRLGRDLDTVRLAPGFSYAENSVGTNGIGTTLETRKPTLVVGAEHYRESLVGLACAGVPVVDPMSGRMLGVIDLTGRIEHGGALMMTLALSAAKQIEDRLLEMSGSIASSLLHAYNIACRRHAGTMVLAVSDDLVLMNQRLRRTVESSDQAAMLEHAVDCATTGKRSAAEELPSGLTVRITRVDTVESLASAALFTVHIVDSAALTPSSRRLPASLPGLVGHGSVWRQACTDLLRALETSQWAVASGEKGTGRCSALKAAAETYRPGHVRVFGPESLAGAGLAELADELDHDGFNIILRDIDTLDSATVEQIADLVSGCVDHGWLGMTADLGDGDTTLDTVLLPIFVRTVTIPALRYRIEDLQDLVPLLLRRITRGDDLRMSPAAMRQLAKYGWPGNVAELRNTLLTVVRKQRTGVVDIDQLPPVCRTFGRHTLSQIEALERDAIVRALTENDYNKRAAAESLGLSRATIYRKIKQFSIAT